MACLLFLAFISFRDPDPDHGDSESVSDSSGHLFTLYTPGWEADVHPTLPQRCSDRYYNTTNTAVVDQPEITQRQIKVT